MNVDAFSNDTTSFDSTWLCSWDADMDAIQYKINILEKIQETYYERDKKRRSIRLKMIREIVRGLIERVVSSSLHMDYY